MCFKLKSNLKCSDVAIHSKELKKKHGMCSNNPSMGGRGCVSHLTHDLSSSDWIFKRALLYAVCVSEECADIV